MELHRLYPFAANFVTFVITSPCRGLVFTLWTLNMPGTQRLGLSRELSSWQPGRCHASRDCVTCDVVTWLSWPPPSESRPSLPDWEEASSVWRAMAGWQVAILAMVWQSVAMVHILRARSPARPSIDPELSLYYTFGELKIKSMQNVGDFISLLPKSFKVNWHKSVVNFFWHWGFSSIVYCVQFVYKVAIPPSPLCVGPHPRSCHQRKKGSIYRSHDCQAHTLHMLRCYDLTYITTEENFSLYSVGGVGGGDNSDTLFYFFHAFRRWIYGIIYNLSKWH